MKLKTSIIEAPILCYPDPNKRYIVYTGVSDDASGMQLFQEHDGTEFPIAFLSHTFMETQRKWSTTEQEASGVYYALPNGIIFSTELISYYKMITSNATNSLTEKNVNNKVNRWGLELATYNITFEWISGAQNEAANCL